MGITSEGRKGGGPERGREGQIRETCLLFKRKGVGRRKRGSRQGPLEKEGKGNFGFDGGRVDYRAKRFRKERGN